MSQVIPEKYRDLFQKRAFASLGTLMPDGRPQVTPVWCDLDGEHVIFNSAKGRQKDKNVRRDPRVSLAIIDPENPYRYLEIRGKVVEITEDGASANIDKLAKKYLGVDKYPYGQPGEVRVIYKVKPEHTTVMGSVFPGGGWVMWGQPPSAVQRPRGIGAAPRGTQAAG